MERLLGAPFSLYQSLLPAVPFGPEHACFTGLGVSVYSVRGLALDFHAPAFFQRESKWRGLLFAVSKLHRC